eukprot:GHVS01072370.1.p1 GENE.GHVS01072370.1~~GHVS01072370.1.p1  ORF type:complete len:330 (+),score=10.61 GHVS01072370.1:145-990(+)
MSLPNVSVVAPFPDLEVFFLQPGKELHSMPDQQDRKYVSAALCSNNPSMCGGSWTSSSKVVPIKFSDKFRSADLEKFRDKDNKLALVISPKQDKYNLYCVNEALVESDKLAEKQKYPGFYDNMKVQVHPEPSTYQAVSELLDGLQDAAEQLQLHITLMDSPNFVARKVMAHSKDNYRVHLKCYNCTIHKFVFKTSNKHEIPIPPADAHYPVFLFDRAMIETLSGQIGGHFVALGLSTKKVSVRIHVPFYQLIRYSYDRSTPYLEFDAMKLGESQILKLHNS